MRKDSYDMSKEELRRQRRKKEQMRAYGLLAVMIVVVVAILGGVGFGIYSFINRKPAEEPQEVVVEEEPIIVEEPEPLVSENEVTEEPEEEPEEALPVEVTDEMKAELLDEYIAGQIANMTLEQKVAGLFFVTPEELTGESSVTIGGSTLNGVLNEYPVGGLYLTESNMESPEQLKEMIFNIKSFTHNEMFIGISEIGGEGSPLVVSGLSEAVISSQPTLGESEDNSGAYMAGIAIGNQMNEYGINTVIGPLADIALEEDGFTSADSFNSDPARVKDLVRNTVHGIEDQNVNCCVKFFPGYGDVAKSPENSRPTSDRTKEDIVEKDYPIYDDAIDGGADFIMVSQIAYDSITGDVPACLAPEVVTEMLRGELEYDGIIITDNLDTRSIVMHYKHADMAVMAIRAGADMLFCSGDFKKAYNGILEAVADGDITEERINESIYRIYRVKYRDMVDYENAAREKGWIQ